MDIIQTVWQDSQQLISREMLQFHDHMMRTHKMCVHTTKRNASIGIQLLHLFLRVSW